MLAEAGWELLERAGEGGAATVWRARAADGRLAALKVGRDDTVVLREAELAARAGRRWGPEALDAGRIGGRPYVALAWVDGEVLGVRPPCSHAEREALAVIVAHGVGRALAELHAAGLRHGDVKPANIVVAGRVPGRDVASERGATLIDMSLAADVGEGVRGGTHGYIAPEVADGGIAGPAADVYALGRVLAEIAGDARDARKGELARWIDAATARAAGARPSAEWIADRAARALGLAHDPEEDARARAAHVERAYLAVRGHEIGAGRRVSASVGEPARGWLEKACAWAAKVGRAADTRAPIGEMGALARARWIVALCGPHAAAWPVEAGAEDGALAARLVELAAHLPPGAWTRDDVAGGAQARAAELAPPSDETDRWAWLTRELARPAPDPRVLSLAEDEAAARRAPRTVILEAARALARRAEIGRAWAILDGLDGTSGHGPAWSAHEGDDAVLLRADLARRRGDARAADALATRAGANALRARLAWDAGDLDGADALLAHARGAAAAEVRGLVCYRRGAYEEGIAAVTDALAATDDGEVGARLAATRGMLEHARGDSVASLEAFGRAVELAVRAGAVTEEATYLTGEAAAATDAGSIDRALASATRAALLWERLGRPAQAARAWLSRASALSTIGASHAAEDAACEAARRAEDAGDMRARAYARWAIVEARAPGDERARAEAVAADAELAGTNEEDRLRATARLLVWAPLAVDVARVAAMDRVSARASGAARWEWWGARAAAIVARAPDTPDAAGVLGALGALVAVPAPIGSRGPALAAAIRLAAALGDGEAARRFEVARRAAAKTLREGTPEAWLGSLSALEWARADAGPLRASDVDVELAPAQIAQLESIVRALGSRDGLRPLLEQVLDTMVLWTGVERGLLLLRAPDGRLVPRAARNLGRRDITGDQLALSQGIARRAIETGEPVVATDAYASLGELHASVHALRLRSVLAVPLLARGETLGVVYLDDRARRGAFGPRELAWVRLVASQAAIALADARDQALLKRAARRADRARAEVQRVLAEREVELSATRAELSATRGDRARYNYDAIVGQSRPIGELLRLVDRVTESDVPVLFVGESGTGKELVARAVHANGARARRAFVSENCAAVPEPLLESTLFGHLKGAFTGASSTRAGLFDVADGGTLFLDEIGEMSLAMQTKLLRVLQDGEVRPVGGDRARKVDVRVLAATHRELEAMVAAGTFREDLFYRLNVVQLRVPPLRERDGDVPLLVAHLLEKHAVGRAVKVTRAAMDRLARYAWPGNVRQLENEVRRALVLAGDRIDVGDLSPEIARGGPSAARGAGFDLRARVDALEAELVREALGKTAGNQTRAAELLGISRFGLQKMMRRLKVRA